MISILIEFIKLNRNGIFTVQNNGVNSTKLKFTSKKPLPHKNWV